MIADYDFTSFKDATKFLGIVNKAVYGVNFDSAAEEPDCEHNEGDSCVCADKGEDLSVEN